jgi:hypothetical protein
MVIVMPEMTKEKCHSLTATEMVAVVAVAAMTIRWASTIGRTSFGYYFDLASNRLDQLLDLRVSL